MVRAIGTDIVSTARIGAALERTGRKFAQRILTELEMTEFDSAHNPAAFLAKRFAAKEAAAKALGTGIGRGISWHHMHIAHDEMGAPLLILSGAAAQRQTDLGSQKAHLSIADELDQALAFVVLS
jgi:holo-[acyl-carrier protein] synthase|tara:strand:- start:256 stop:630 length:375 start_codon:yes stop_codon:yes gene_type:complete